jgi:general secretion pathway protein H
MSFQRPAHGFTLVEILVVLLILALAGGLAVALLDRDERGTAAREAKRFAGALEYAATRAQSRNETLGVSADRTVRFWRRDSGGDRWLPIDGEDALAAHTLPDPLTAAPVAYAGQRVATNAIIPLHSTGRNEPFAFALASPNWRVVLASDPLSRVTIAGPVPTTP